MGTAGRLFVSFLVAQLGGAAVLATECAAQPASTGAPVDGSARGGFSFGLGKGGSGLAGLATLRAGGRRSAVILRGLLTDEFAILGGPNDNDSDLALLYGRRIEYPDSWVGVAAGPALAFSTRGIVKQKTLGLALQGEAVWSPAYAFGLGLTGFANINAKHSFGGVVVGFHLGKQRSSVPIATVAPIS